MERPRLSNLITLGMLLFLADTAIAQEISGERQPPRSIDEQLIASINASSGKSIFWDDVMLGTSRSLMPVVIALPAGQVVSGLINNDKATIYAGLTVWGGTALTVGIQELVVKPLVKRNRPYVDVQGVTNRDPDVFGYSFPSSHSGVSTGFAVGEALQYGKWYVTIPLAVYASIVMFSRPYLGVHYPTDLLAGAILGSTIQFLCYRLEQSLLSASKNTIIRSAASSPPVISFSIKF